MPNLPTQPRLVEIAIEAKSKADHEKLRTALVEFVAEDSSFGFLIDLESGQIVLSGASELHLEEKLDVLRRTYNIDARVGAPQVAFRERVTRNAVVEYTHRKQSGRSGQFAGVKLQVEPNKPGKGNQFESKIVGGALPREYIPAVEKGVESVLPSGVVAGFPVVDVKVTLLDGKYHDVDSSRLTFEIAARAAFREALLKAGSVLLEPIMKVEVTMPEEYIDPVVSDLNLRRAQMIGRSVRGGANVVSAKVPLMNMFGYGNSLHSMTQDRATFAMQLDCYAPAPSPDDDPPFRPAMGMRA
jgi:translation elongation factor EF-G